MSEHKVEYTIEVETPHGKIRVSFPKEFLDKYGGAAMRQVREAINAAAAKLAPPSAPTG